MAKELSSYLLVDDFYFAAHFDQNENANENQTEIFSVSDEKYAEELQLQEVIIGAVLIASQAASNALLAIEESPTTSSAPDPVAIGVEMGEPSQILCEICMERKESNKMFRNGSCSHSFCTDCISKHVATKIQDNINTVVCPGLNCRGVLELDTCKMIIPQDVLARWDEALSESMILSSEKFYCPFKDCSAMLVNDNGGEVIRESECPICRRLFCAQCYVPWHGGLECEEFQSMNDNKKGKKEDLLVRELAKEKSWQRCPSCNFYVDKTEGCLHITCRCKFEFCYGCGAKWTQNHGGCQ